jgi:ribonuclease P protein component
VETCRFPKSARLSRSDEFRRVRENGRSITGRYMILGVLQDADAHQARVGIVTSRRVGCAVERNRVRRRLREIIRVKRGSVRAGTWMVLVARRAAADGSFHDIESEWLRLARRADII